MWKRIELEEIGIPFGNDHQVCKIVLTSRSRSVCDQMDCEKIFTVETLSKQESWVLFKELSGLVAENDEISPIARDIAAKCGGLPIAIVTIARALKNKNQHVWSDAARQLSKSFPANIEGIQGSVIASLELSYNYLESGEAKSLFLFCSLFPEDFKIPVEVLMRYGVGLRWFENVETMEDIRERVHAVVSTLTNSFLLIDDYNNNDGNDNVETCVKMHDVVRDFALIIAPKYNHAYMVRAGVGLKEWPSRETFGDLTAISLISNDIKEVHDGLDCPKLETLLLRRSIKMIYSDELVVPNYFFQGMKHLRVIDLTQNTVLAMPESLSLLSNLRTLYLNHCKLGDLSVIGKLSKLEILSLFRSDFKDIPISFSQLTFLRLLDLNGCWRLELIPRGVIPCLRKLEELYIDEFEHWDSESEEDLGSNARLSELKVLSRLTRLHICIPNLDISPHDLSFQNLISFTLKIGLQCCIWGRNRITKMTLSDMSTSKIPGWVKNLLKRTESLILNEITGSDQNVLDDLVQGGFNNLKSLTICSSEIKYLLNTVEWTPNLTFHNLEELRILHNPNLFEICYGQPPAQTFNKLKSLRVYECNNMLNIIPSHLLQRLVNLESIAATACRSAVYIFDCEGLEKANQKTKLILPLKQLALQNLPAVTHIGNGNGQLLSFCNPVALSVQSCRTLKKLFSPTLLQSVTLESIVIFDCSSLEEIFFENHLEKKAEDEEKDIVGRREDHSITSPSLRNLTFLSIKYCSKLGELFNPSIVKSLMQLKSFTIHCCSTIQEIVINEEGENGPSTERLVFPNLYYMSLSNLESLTCFSSGLYTIEFPALEELIITKCPKMKTFSHGRQVTPKLKAVIESEYPQRGRRNGDLNTTMQQIFIEQRRQELNQEEPENGEMSEEEYPENGEMSEEYENAAI